MHPGQTCTHSGPQAPGGGQEHRIAGDSGGEEVEHADRVSPVKAGRLRHVADQRPGLVAPCPLELNGSGVRHLSQDGTEKRALSRPVGADKGHDLPAVQVEGNISQYFLPAETHPKVGGFQTAGTGTAGPCGSVLVYAHPNASAMVSIFFCMASR